MTGPLGFFASSGIVAASGPAVVIGTPTHIALSTSSTPGAQNITVPSDAKLAVVMWCFHRTGTHGLSSLTSDFTGTFTNFELGTSGTSSKAVGVSYADVTSTGSKTITPAWTGTIASGDGGPIFYVIFVKGHNIGNPTEGTPQFARRTVGGTAAITLTSQTTSLVLALDNNNTTAPATETGYTSLATVVNNGIGGNLRRANTPGASTTAADDQGGDYSAIGGVAIRSA